VVRLLAIIIAKSMNVIDEDDGNGFANEIYLIINIQHRRDY
jgi:hypothetical protein